MSNPIFSFYHSWLTSFHPRSESFLYRISADEILRQKFRYIFTVDAMTEISHMIEDLIIRTPATSDTHVSFQYFSRLRPQLERYRKVAEASQKVFLYGIDDIQPPDLPKTKFIVTRNTPLERYWFVVGYGAGLYACLLAEEIPDETRSYEGFYTFEPEAAFQLILGLHRMFPESIPLPEPPERHGISGE